MSPVVFEKIETFFLCCQFNVSPFLSLLSIDSNKIYMTHVHPLESNEKKTIKNVWTRLCVDGVDRFLLLQKFVFIQFYLIS